jgi:signal transduction histidine kinase
VSTLLAGRPRVAVQAALPALLSQLSHDLNNHLTTVLGKAELALLVEDPARWKRAFTDIQVAGRSAQRVVSDLQKLVAWSLPEHDPVQPRDVAELACRLVERRASQSAIATAVTGDAAVPLAIGAAEAATCLVMLLQSAFAQRPATPARFTVAVEEHGRGVAFALHTPGVVWDAEALQLAERALQHDERAPRSVLEWVVACLAALECNGQVDGDRFWFEIAR